MFAEFAERWTEPAARLAVALLTGAIIGINRDLHNKPIGLRTLGMVALGSCLLVLTLAREAAAQGLHSIDGVSRAAQGIVSGIGFLGAGVILRTPDQLHVRGLTTAATIWVCATLGIACAIAPWGLIALGFIAALALLVIGGPIEKAIHTRIGVVDASTDSKQGPD